MTAPTPAALRARPRVPLWKQIELDEQRRRSRRFRRLAVVYDIEGPRVRLGILWFLFNVAALTARRPGLTVLYAAVAGVAALQTARAWRSGGERPHRLAAGAGAAALPVAAAFGTGPLGLAILVATTLAVLMAYLQPPRRRGPVTPPVRDAGFTIQCSLFVGLAAASVVLAHRYEPWGAVALVLMVAAYETGDYIVGSGAANPFEGPTAGIASILVVTFFVGVFAVPPFEARNAWVFGAMAAVLCPLGQLAGSLVLPGVAARAPALRRLDSLLLLGPAWALGVGVLAR